MIITKGVEELSSKVFIGSSVKGLPVAEAIQKELAYDAEVTTWAQGVFRSTNVPIEDLMAALGEFDFAIFVFLPEDTLKIRDEQAITVRDNVLFELGMFLGRLGRRRNFFVTPETKPKTDLHLPSDLSGITPATYVPGENMRASLAPALYEIKEAIRRLGPLKKQETVLYDSRRDFKPYHLNHRNSRFYKDDKPNSPRSDGSLHLLVDGFKVERRTVEGRYEIELRQKGVDSPSISKEHEPIHRVFRVGCEVKIEGGEHTLRFVLKDVKAGRWADSKQVSVASSDWTQIELYLSALSTVDLLFRIDDEKPASAPSSVFIRHLVIADVIAAG